ncbi:uncharacterized protein LOC108265703 [Ictalurus punctatus]|uniref:exodeoxyribonuclease III n=1 Tax=Ictalurus punctatus TaxID=7998 RepID=A0A2D0QZH1_ICTPU|nr:uncharacterized protein LOC108265703 [Ictalurus punctatus]XP_017323814.1 uncharacterized protein LOC108265703 [Ictalurus punctatus]
MMPQEKTSLRFVTWNTNGIRSPDEKFAHVLHSLSKLQADIVFIQETRVGPNSYHILTDVKDWKVYFTVHSPKSKGVAILIKNNVPFEYICHDEDCSGGYIVLFCHLYGELHTLVNVYNHKADRRVLGRLKEYLMETAEGVLVVGGDFNTVLHPSFDRSSSTLRPSTFRDVLEDFTASLNLRDTWSYLRYADEGFTRSQNESQSRIDMFFLHKDTLVRARNITVQGNVISDHNPVVLELEVQQQTEKTFPKVSLLFKQIPNNRRPNRIPGKISGAEILGAIKTLADSQEQRPGEKQVGYYKSHRCPVTESLKITYNNMLKTNHVSEAFKESYPSRDRYVFSAEYLIFSQILAKRLSAYISPYIKEKPEKNLDKFLTVTFEKGIQEIKFSFLETSRELHKDLRSFVPPTMFRILGCLLPEVQGSSGEVRHLLPGCPLTSTILNLALNKLDWIINSEKKCRSSVCFHRQALLIHAHQSKQERVVWLIEKFQEESGIKFQKQFHR